jgi:hypothetical protein
MSERRYSCLATLLGLALLGYLLLEVLLRTTPSLAAVPLNWV